MRTKPYNRARNLDDRAIEQIVEILYGWSSPKLTWDLLIQQIMLHLRSEYSRQALYKHTRIKEAFVARKLALSNGDQADLRALTPDQQRIARLEAENERLKQENNNLLEQFHRWVYNGYLKQMDERMREFMNQPLPGVHRDPSRIETVVAIASKRRRGTTQK